MVTGAPGVEDIGWNPPWSCRERSTPGRVEMRSRRGNAGPLGMLPGKVRICCEDGATAGRGRRVRADRKEPAMSLSEASTGTLSRAESVLAALDEEQRAAAQAVSGPVCILAGAGTGKTRTITHRIAYGVHTGVYVPEQVLAVTFTARAAGELRARLASLDVGGVQARTFHAAAMRQLRYFAPKVLGGPMPPLIENKLRVVAGAASRNRLTTDRASLRDLAGEIEWAKTTLATPDDYPAPTCGAGERVGTRAAPPTPADSRPRPRPGGGEPPFEAAAVAAVYAGY